MTVPRTLYRVLRVALLLALPACGRLGFGAEQPDTSADASVDAGLRWVVVLDDQFNDDDPLTNPSGLGRGFHVQGADAREANGQLFFGNYPQDYAASLGVSLDALPLGNGERYRIEWDIVPGPATAFLNGPEFVYELFAIATTAGNNNFNGSSYFNATGGLYARIFYSEDAGRVTAAGQVVATDSSKPAMCDSACAAGYQRYSNYDLGDIGSVGAARVTVRLELDALHFAYSFAPGPAIAINPALLENDLAALALHTGNDLQGGIYVGAAGGNFFTGRASAGVDAIRVFQLK